MITRRLSFLLVVSLLVAFISVAHFPTEKARAVPTYDPSGPYCTTTPGSSSFPGTLAGQPYPLWCYGTLNTGPGTQISGANFWGDDFNHGLTLADCCPGYRTFDDSANFGTKMIHWRHNNHWMIDLAPVADPALKAHCDADPQHPPFCPSVGGGFMRPDRSFNFDNGVFVMQTDVSAGIETYGGDAWTEIGITSAPAPTGSNVDSLYAYGQFGGAWTVGCRLQMSNALVPGGNMGGMTCAVEAASPTGLDPNDRAPCYSFGTYRQQEISGFQQCGTSHHNYDTDAYANQQNVHCAAASDPDGICRIRVRMEVTKTSLAIYIRHVDLDGVPIGPDCTRSIDKNGMCLYLQDGGWDTAHDLPDSFINGPIYAYMADWQVFHSHPVYRFHWDRVEINPELAGGGATPTPTPAPPTNTPTPVPPTNTPTPVTPTSTSTPVPPTNTPTVVPPTATPTPCTPPQAQRCRPNPVKPH